MAPALTAAASVSPSWHDSSSFLSLFSKKSKGGMGGGAGKEGWEEEKKDEWGGGYTESQPGQFISVL